MQRAMKYLLVLTVFVWASFSTYILLQTPIEDRIMELVPREQAIFDAPVYEERINNLHNGYNGRAYVFEFDGFDKVKGCKLISSDIFLDSSVFENGHKLYGALHFIPRNQSICLKEISNGDGDRELLISHKGGIVYFSIF
ncbi:MAG: hypothetical protein COB54_07700 [Alphaproteobacteria bacterium]|nr:MAG: hypothetical protein COB54_07700 [Alphaproteobacteria bacterium]